MQGNRRQTLDALKLKMAALEANPVLTDGADTAVGGGLLATPGGVVHEIFAGTVVDAGAALGFALGQARGRLGAARPALVFAQLRADAGEIGLPYGLGLSDFGIAAEAMVLVRAESIGELLWAVEEAIACRAVGAVVADIAFAHKALDFTASRRLSLRAAASGAAVLMVRYGREREASAAKFRWQVAPMQSRPPLFDRRAPGGPRWRVKLEKGQLGRSRRAGPEGEDFIVDWTADGFVLADIDGRNDARAAAVAALPAAAPAALGHRLSQAG
jgi:protein ImuA